MLAPHLDRRFLCQRHVPVYTANLSDNTDVGNWVNAILRAAAGSPVHTWVFSA
jgi:hypothetical protein